MKTDKEMTEDVEAELCWTPEVDDSHIKVGVVDGIVTLTGSVPAYRDKIHAECAAQRVYGVTAVANDIEVSANAPDQQTDPQIARQAVDAIHADLPQASAGVQIVVRDGHVSLEGVVEFAWQRQRIESTVRNVKGIYALSNLIAIRRVPLARATDASQGAGTR
ncbi:MAG: BON domain-containing protein [Pseudomonadota bacterium]